MKSRMYHVSGSDEEVQVNVPLDGDASFQVNGSGVEYQVESLGNRRYLVRGSQGQVWTVDMDNSGGSTLVESNGHLLRLSVLSERDKLLGGGNKGGGAASGDVSVSMPGKIVKVMVSAGAQVGEGDAILIAEAMKMENEVKSPCAGVVQEVCVEVGDTVEPGQLLVRITPEGADEEAS